jgi:CheY-like chemotaxis protein
MVLAAFRRWRVTNRVKIVGDGEQAKAYLVGEGQYADRRRYPFPSLVLLDLQMPRLSGLELLRWIRTTAGISDLAVVVLTGSTNRQDFERAYHLGANACAVKSLDLTELRDLVQHMNYFALAESAERGDVEFFPEEA